MALALPFGLRAGQPAGYVDPAVCASCHAQIYRTYQRTGMGRSFSPARHVGVVKDFEHPASDSHYSVLLRNGKYFQRRWQIGYQGKEENVEELPIDYVMGSGNHARTYLSRTARGALIELPLGWYAEQGGYWGMNPGYDATHPPARRPVAYECMFCHNGYPGIPDSRTASAGEPVFEGALPEGIDCQRCHGPGEKHARSGGRAAIGNPARLSQERQMEVCLQCHLETTSTRLPSLIRRFDRAPFSYVPGEPLGDFILSFDHAPGTGHEDKFEIAGGAYRLRQSQCFLKSQGALTCVTCHDPHNVIRGAEATAQYAGVCRQCHAALPAEHPQAPDCVSCHMPKRRTEDAVHVVITDHRIQRRQAARDLLAELPERHPTRAEEYRGAVVPYYPSPLPPTPENLLYIALAQVQHGSNVEAGRKQLEQAPAPFRKALEEALGKPRDPEPGTADLENTANFENNEGALLMVEGKADSAEAAFRRALQADPWHAEAHANLARLLAGKGDREQAVYHFGKAAQLQPGSGATLYEYALTLVQMDRFEDSQQQVEAAVSADPNLAEAHELLGGLLSRKKDLATAQREYEEAVRLKPEFGRAQLDLALTLAARGDRDGAILHLREAARSSDSRAAAQAGVALRQLGVAP